MSLLTTEIDSVKLTFDKEKTQENRTDYNIPCECQYCRNYYKNIDNSPEIKDFLSSFGIDYLRAEEIIPYDLGNDKDSPICYNAYYCVFGSIDDEASLKKEAYTVSFRKSAEVNVGHKVTDDMFFVVLGIELPYILEEERDMPIQSRIGRWFGRIKSVFCK